jgi:transposase-like protein
MRMRGERVPSKLTDEATERLVQSLRAGASIPDAAAFAGLSANTVKSWLRRGRREAGTPFARLAANVDAARAEWTATHPLNEADLLRLLEQAAMRGSVRATVVLLNRIDRARERDGAGAPRARDPFGELDAANGPSWEEIYAGSNDDEAPGGGRE